MTEKQVAQLAELTEKQEAQLAELTEKYETQLAELKKMHVSEHEELETARKKADEAENDMIEYLDLLEEKEKEIARLKFKLQENQYE